jgi:hypothetical protein
MIRSLFKNINVDMNGETCKSHLLSWKSKNQIIRHHNKFKLPVFIVLSILMCAIIISTCFLMVPKAVSADPEELPRIEITPFEGSIGTTVYIRIFDYTPENVVFVKFGNQVITTITVETDVNGFAVASFILDLTPAGTFPIYVDDGIYEDYGYFNVLPSVNTDELGGAVGDIVTIDGYGFSAEKPISIYFDSTKISTSDTDELGTFSNARFSIPATPLGKHVIKVQDSEGYTVSYDYNVTQKMIVEPYSVCVNNKVNISGMGFPAITNLVVFFDGEDISAMTTDAYGVFSTNITVPPCGDGIHTIKVSDGVNPAFGDVIVNPNVHISDSSGYIGMQLTITGTGFRIGNNLNATYDETRLNGTTVDDLGNFVFSFNVPRSISGSHTITVTDGVNTKSMIFNVESTPPLAPNLELPVDGTRFTNEIRFQWEAVTDPSGVFYVIEIANDARFTQPTISQGNLEQTYYDLPDDPKITPGRSEPYFWRVRAIDYASNQGNWSVVGTFYKGYTVGSIMSDMPGWTKFILIALGLVLFIFLILFIWKSVRRVSEVEYSEDDTYSELESEYDNDWEEMPNPNKRLNR